MTGRYGPDQLGTALIVVALVLNIAFQVLGVPYGMVIAYALLAFAMFRILSRNIQKRRRENDRFLRFWAPVRSRAKRRAVAFRDRGTHRYFVCPSCKNTLRVPKGRGKLQITCPRCGERFIKKS
jgi:DNA-directed RNA polymerase subunit RPC12/RpoP